MLRGLGHAVLAPNHAVATHTVGHISARSHRMHQTQSPTWSVSARRNSGPANRFERSLIRLVQESLTFLGSQYPLSHRSSTGVVQDKLHWTGTPAKMLKPVNIWLANVLNFQCYLSNNCDQPYDNFFKKPIAKTAKLMQGQMRPNTFSPANTDSVLSSRSTFKKIWDSRRVSEEAFICSFTSSSATRPYR